MIEEITLKFKEEEIKPQCKKTYGYKARETPSLQLLVAEEKVLSWGENLKEFLLIPRGATGLA